MRFISLNNIYFTFYKLYGRINRRCGITGFWYGKVAVVHLPHALWRGGYVCVVVERARETKVHEEVIVCKRAGTSYTLARLNRTHVRTQPQPWYYLVALLGCLPVLRFMHARLGYRAKGTASHATD